MPTQSVRPESGDLLQEIADVLWKSRKIVVITGAGISTNSGIPDFRSENGLYSMIQAQLDVAVSARGPKDNGSLMDVDLSQDLDNHSAKRRKTCRDGETTDQGSPRPAATAIETTLAQDSRSLTTSDDTREGVEEPRTGEPCDLILEASLPALRPAQSQPQSPPDLFTPAEAPVVVLEQCQYSTQEPARLASTPRCPRGFSQASPRRLSAPEQDPTSFSSSPLSSPPPIIFDPYEEDSYMHDSTPPSSQRGSSSSSSAASDTEDASHPRRPFLASQPSNPSRSSLPNLKGRDLFDATIWADPLKTSVFYSFTTSLRQRAKTVSPTGCHYFISHLRDSGKLVRCYTQNIDQMEEKVGLATGLDLGPGSRGRFSTRSARPSGVATTAAAHIHGSRAEVNDVPNHPDRTRGLAYGAAPNRGVECVFLHGSLQCLRCFQCGRTSDWDQDGREHETLLGRQPPCPHCEGATAKRQEEGKRALGVGKLRPDIVLYGEEHPKAHLISPIVQHDLSLAPDFLLILGTSLRVHGLKVMVKEFAKAVHNRGGKVVFINFTKPPESVWADTIDYWVEWDCDAWVEDLKEKKPVLWLPPGTVTKNDTTGGTKKRTEGRREVKSARKTTRSRLDPATAGNPLDRLRSGNDGGRKQSSIFPEQEQAGGDMTEKSVAKRPMALRDDYTNAAYLTCKIVHNLARISGRQLQPAPFMSSLEPPTALLPSRETPASVPKPKKQRKSAPGILHLATVTIRGEARAKTAQAPASCDNPCIALLPDNCLPLAPLASFPLPVSSTVTSTHEDSVVAAVKSNPRKRKRKAFFDDNLLPSVAAGKDAPIAPSSAEAREKPSPRARPPKPLTDTTVRSSGKKDKKPRQGKKAKSGSICEPPGQGAVGATYRQPWVMAPMPEDRPADLTLPPLELTPGQHAAPRLSDEPLHTLEPALTSPGPLILSPGTRDRPLVAQHIKDPFFIKDVLFHQMTSPPQRICREPLSPIEKVLRSLGRPVAFQDAGPIYNAPLLATDLHQVPTSLARPPVIRGIRGTGSPSMPLLGNIRAPSQWLGGEPTTPSQQLLKETEAATALSFLSQGGSLL